jgi:hypothetical protein
MAQKINVGTIKGNFYGGLPYSASWSFNDGSSPSTLNVSVVNSQGKYPDISNDLTYTKTVTVQLGEFKFVGYLVSYEINETPEQKLLTLNYIDQSVDLDRYYVGLDKRHGLAGALKNLIVVGKEYHPCDPNLDSTKGYNNVGKSPVDPCDPCPYMPSNKYDMACDPARADFQIFEVYYTFNDLLGKIPLKNSGVPKANSTYKAQHTGTLKSVLSSWCSELGLAYYWDPFKGQLCFVDRSKPILVPQNLRSEQNVIEYRHGANKQNTFSRGFIGYFAKQGEYKKYTCTVDPTNSFQSLAPLTVADMLDPGNYPKTNELAIKELSCAMAKYGKPLRDAFLWYYAYGFSTASDLNDFKYDVNNASSLNNVITPLGKMKVLRVYHPSLKDENSGDFPALSRQTLNADEYQALQDQDKVNNRDLTNPSWYFFIAECDDELADKQFQSEEKLGSDFLGKYFYKSYNTPIPGASNSNTQVSTETPDGGSASWYINNKDVSSLSIFGFGHEDGSVIAKLVTEAQNNKDPIKLDNKKKLVTAQSFLLGDRSNKFLPTNEQIKDYDALFKWYKEYTPTLLNSDGRPDILFDFYPEAKNNTNIKLFLAREYSDFQLSIDTVPHPLEANSMALKTETHENAVGDQIVKNIGSYGLTSNECIRITIGSHGGGNAPNNNNGSGGNGAGNSSAAGITKTDIVIHTPPQCFKYVTKNQSSSSDFVDLSNPAPTNAVGSTITSSQLTSNYAPGYVIYAQATATFPKVLPKVQYAVGSDGGSLDVAHLDYTYKEIQEENLDSITQSKNCVPSQKQVQQYVSSLGKNFAYSMDRAQSTATIKLPGIVPKVWGIEDALNSIQITINENSSYTTYSFEDKIIMKPSESYFTQYLLDKAKPLSSLGTQNTDTQTIQNIQIGISTKK